MLYCHQNKIKILHPRLPTPSEKYKVNRTEKSKEEPYPNKLFNLT